MEEKLRNLKNAETEKHQSRRQIGIILSTLIIVADIIISTILVVLALESKEVYYYIQYYDGYYHNIIIKILSGLIIIVFAVCLDLCIECWSSTKMHSNIEIESEQILFDFIRFHSSGYIEVKVKYGCGLSHEAYDFIANNRNCKLYAKSVADKQVYIWASDENGKEVQCWIETAMNFLYHFVAIEE